VKVFSDQQNDKKEITIRKPILEKPEKCQQTKPTDHFINIQTHVDREAHEGEKNDVKNNPKFFHGWLSDIF
jgi:hypothetical protein